MTTEQIEIGKQLSTPKERWKYLADGYTLVEILNKKRYQYYKFNEHGRLVVKQVDSESDWSESRNSLTTTDAFSVFVTCTKSIGIITCYSDLIKVINLPKIFENKGLLITIEEIL